MILQALEDDQPIAGRLDLVHVDLEAVSLAKPELRQLAFDQELG